MNDKRKRLLIIGAGAAGSMIIGDFIKSTDFIYDIVGVIDDEENKKDSLVYGVKVLGNRYDIERICKKLKVSEILIAIPSISARDKAEIIKICTRTTCQIKILPNLSEIMKTGSLKFSVRSVQVEDLLAREPVTLNNDKISEYIKGKNILVTGGGGSIGAELCRQIARYYPKKIIVFDIYENNAYDLQNEFAYLFPYVNIEIVIGSVRDKERLNSVFAKHRPHIVFHAAAHKHVPLMESNPSEAVINNVFGTLNTANCAKKYNVNKFILISTDKAVNPTNVMGATKRLCEMLIQSMGNDCATEFAAVRFGNVLGSNGSVIPLFKRQIKTGGPITITHKDITRFFMTISEAAQLVLEAASYAQGGEIYVLDMGEPVKIFDLALNLIKLSGLEPFKDINIEFIGLRSGEKLYEEILMDEEGITCTTNNKIHVAKPINIDRDSFERGLRKLSESVVSHHGANIRRVLKELVTTYSYNEPYDFVCDNDMIGSAESPKTLVSANLMIN